MLTAIDRLPAHMREALTMVRIDGLKFIEVADVLGVPMGTAKSRLARALEHPEMAAFTADMASV